jgi:hypothetical protein
MISLHAETIWDTVQPNLNKLLVAECRRIVIATTSVWKVWLACKRGCWRLNSLVWWLLRFFVTELVWIGLGLNWYDFWFDNWFGLGRVWICMIIGSTIGLDWYESLKFLLIEYFVWFGLHEYDIHFYFQVTRGHIIQPYYCTLGVQFCHSSM